MKICSTCKVEKDDSEFHRSKNRPDGLNHRCKACRKQEISKISSEDRKKKDADYYKRRKEYILIKKSEYYLKNREKIRESQAIYLQNNKSKIYAIDKQCKMLRRNTDPLYKLTHQVRCLIRNQLKYKGFSKKSKTTKLIGCTFEQLMEWLGPKPCDNPHLDHVVPCAQAKTEEELIKLQHYMNFQWLTPEENLKKSDNKTYAGEFLCQILLGRDWC